MKSKQLVLIAIALLCGLVSAIGIIQAMGNKGEVAAKIPMGPVLVASSHLDLKAELSEENIRLESWPQDVIPEGAATDLADVSGKFILTRLRSGQAIILEDVKPESEIPGKAIPPNHKVINIKVPSEDLIGGLLEPGDRVDIIGVFSTRRGGEQNSETQTFLKGIRIFNIGTNTSAQNKNKAATASGIVGVLVTEAQSEKTVWARKNGEIRLALVGDHDVGEQPDPEFPMGQQQQPEVVKHQPEPQPAGLSNFLNLAASQPKFDKSKLRQVKVYIGDQVRTTYFDEEGNEVSMSKNGSNMSNNMPNGINMPHTGMGGGLGGGLGGGSGTRPPAGAPVGLPSEASGLPSVDYEGSEGSVELPDGMEQDQYRGE